MVIYNFHPPYLKSNIILGMWGLSGDFVRHGKKYGYGKFSVANTMKVLDLAWKTGIRTVDTAFVYGDGRCWDLLNKWSSSRKKKFQVTIKLGRPVINGTPAFKFGIKDLKKELLHAESRIKGKADIILLKDPPPNILRRSKIFPLLEELKKFRPESKIGLSGHDLNGISKIGKALIDCNIAQIEYNLLNHGSAHRLITKIKDQGWNIWCMQPLCYGLLSEKNDTLSKNRFSKSDWRFSLNDSLLERAHFINNQSKKIADTLRPHTISEISIAFVGSYKYCDKIIIGPKSLKQLRSSLKAIELSKNQNFTKKRELLRRHTLKHSIAVQENYTANLK